MSVYMQSVFWVSCVIVLPLLWVGGARSAEPAKPAPNPRVALIIGIDSYQYAPKLKSAVFDATGMRDLLGNPKDFGFDVIPGMNTSRIEMETLLDTFEQRIKNSEIAVFYFAGHGFQADGLNYLVPKDVNLSDREKRIENSIALEKVLRKLGEAPGIKIVILDACRELVTSSSGDREGLGKTAAGVETLIAYATSPGHLAADGQAGGHSVYTRYLKQALRRPGLTVEEVFKVTRLSVVAHPSLNKQVPWENSSLTKNVILFKGDGNAARPSADKELERALAVLAGLKRSVPEKIDVGSVFKECDRCPQMVVIPTGKEFKMGSPEVDREKAKRELEEPQRPVKISRRIAVGKFEVTFDEWEACLLGGGCNRSPNDKDWGRGKQPVINVSWHEAKQYVDWLNRHLNKQSTGQGKSAPVKYRLLSEAEWEYAARSGTETARPWGGELGSGFAVCKDCGGEYSGLRTAPVDSPHKPNPWGLHHMLGNVWEWVEDCENINYRTNPPSDGSAWIAGDCSRRGIRGGSWLTAGKGVRSAARAFYPPQRRDINIGFRVARDLD